jgi:hypothetical protein
VKIIIVILFYINLLSAHEVNWQDKFLKNQVLELKSSVDHNLEGKYLCLALESDPKKSIFVRYKKEIENLRKVLREDETDLVDYKLAKFSCHNFAKMLYLQNSSLAKDMKDYNLEGLQEDWGVKIKRDPSLEKFPMNYITLQSKVDGYFHAINAVLLDKDKPEDLDSYVFIEPQSDVLYSASELKSFSERLMKKDFKGEIKVGIGTFDGFSFNGNIWQSHSNYQREIIIK